MADRKADSDDRTWIERKGALTGMALVLCYTLRRLCFRHFTLTRSLETFILNGRRTAEEWRFYADHSLHISKRSIAQFHSYVKNDMLRQKQIAKTQAGRQIS